MTRKTVGFFCALGAMTLGLLSSSALAEVTGGGVTGGTSGGSFQEIPPPMAVGPDAFDAPDLFAFDERQDVLLMAPAPIGPGVIAGPGSVLSSHYVAFDPLDPSRLIGFVDFDEPIVGILAGLQIGATNPLFGLPSVTYNGAPAIGPDPMDSVMIDPTDPNRLLVDFGAGSPGDQLRVLTGVVVPEPAAWALGWLGGLLAVGGRRGLGLGAA